MRMYVVLFALSACSATGLPNGDELVGEDGGVAPAMLDLAMLHAVVHDMAPTPDFANLQWQFQPSKQPGPDLRGIWGSAWDNVYAVGTHTMLHSKGDGKWSAEMASGDGVWGSSATDIYAIQGNVIRHSMGNGQWTSQSVAPFFGLNAIWGSSASDIYVACNGPALIHSNGNGKWTSVALPPLDQSVTQFLALWGSTATDVYVAGAGIVHLIGSQWSIEQSPTMAFLRGLWGSSAKDVYAVGENGTILHSVGNGIWTAQQSGHKGDFSSVWGSGPSDVYATTSLGRVFHSTGDGKWKMELDLYEANYSLYGIWGSGPGDIYVVGGAVYHRAP